MSKKDPGSQEFKTEQKALETRIKRLESQVMRPIKKKNSRRRYYCMLLHIYRAKGARDPHKAPRDADEQKKKYLLYHSVYVLY